MFRSIKWRLVASYVLLTLLTVSVLGVITYTLVRQYITNQEDAFLTTYAEVFAIQAHEYLTPVIEYEHLNNLANAISMLGNFRLILHDANHETLLDTGSPPIIDYFPWIIQGMRVGAERERDPFIISIPEPLEVGPAWGEISPTYIETLLTQLQAQSLHRDEQPWEKRFFVRETTSFLRGIPMDRSTRTFSFPIGGGEIPVAYIQILEGPDFGAQTLETTERAFFIAAGSSVLLSGIIGLLISKRLTSPMIQLSDIADQMSTGDLSIRSPVFGKDEIGQLAQRFNQMAARLEESFSALSSERDALSRFISDASHELRTPITAMKNFIELLQGKAIEDTQAREEFLGKTQKQLERMEWITQNLLNLSRLEAGLLNLKLEQKDVNDVLTSVTSVFKTRIEQEQIEFIIIAPDPSFELAADHSLLETALLNLLDNALKFTSEGGKIKLSARKEGEYVSFTVQDTGIGIDPDDLPHIFERFYRGKSVTAEGSGLGLAMVDSVIKVHGGKRTVESELGIGSTFTITLPKSTETTN